MSRAIILFLVPEDPAGIAELLAEHGAEEGVGGCSDPEEIRDFLLARVGSLGEASFDLDDPMEPIEALAPVLERAGSRYFATFDAFEERSRGLRVLGRAYVNLTGAPADRRELQIPWTHGAPAMDERTLMAGGMTRAEAEAVCDAFFPEPSPGHRP